MAPWSSWLAQTSRWLRPRPEKRPAFLEIRSSRWFITMTIAVAVFTDIFLYAVIVPVVPFALENRAHIASDRTQYWVSILVAIYGAGCVAASPVCGWFADRSSSRRFPLLLGLLALTGATVMLNVGSNIAIFVVARTLQGVSAAVVWVVGLALMADTVGGEQVGQYMGYVGIAMSLGILIAPLLGGVVFASSGYNAVFGMQYGLIALDIIMRFLLVEIKVAQKWTAPQQGTAVVSLAEKKTDEVPSSKATMPQTVEAAGPAAPEITGAESARRLPPVLTLLASRRLLAGMWDVLVIAALMTSFDAVLPLFVHETFGWNSLGAGLLYIALVVPSFIGPIAGWMADRYGPRWILTVGFISCVPWLVMLRLINHNSIGQKVLLCTLLVLIGVALNMVLAPIMAEVSYIVEAKERAATRRGLASPFGKGGAYGQAYALFNTAFSVGAIIGPFWAGFVKESAGWNTMAWSLALLSGASAIPTAIWSGGSFRKVYGRARSSPDEGS